MSEEFGRGCQRIACKSIARWQVGLKLWPRGIPKQGQPPARALIGLVVCDRHAASVSVDDVIGDHGWQIIVMAFAAAGKVEPDRASVEIDWLPFAAGKAFLFADGIGGTA